MDDYYDTRRRPNTAANQSIVAPSDDTMPQLKEAEIRETYLIETMSPYTKTLKESDFVEGAALNDTQQSNEDEDDLYTDYNNYCEPDDIESERKLAESESNSHVNIPVDNRCENSDDNSNDDSVETTMLDDVFEDATVAFVKVPMPGEKMYDHNDPEAIQKMHRTVPGGCVVCLNTFNKGHRVTWSSNSACSHLFHEECILDWLKTSGRKSLRRLRRQRESQGGNEPTRIDVIQEVTSVPWLCPVCRQDFILPKQHENGDIIESKVEATPGIASHDSNDSSTSPERQEVISRVDEATTSEDLNHSMGAAQAAEHVA